MFDQAHDLRRLAVRRRCDSRHSIARPSLLVVAGGKGGVGTTTVASNLAAAISRAGRRTVLVAADAGLMGDARRRFSMADVLAERCGWEEAAQIAPNGVALVIGDRWNEPADRLINSLSNVRRAADVVIIDVGNPSRGAAGRICGLADAVLMVTAPSAAAVVNTFVALESLAGSVSGIYLLVNMAPDRETAEGVYRRLAWTARRLAGLELRSAGYHKLVEGTGINEKDHRFFLNVRDLSVDNVGQLLLSDRLLKWQRSVEFNGRPKGAFAKTVEMDF
ncbi:MAG: P-loop NTPase [Pirellulales bacterium]|nr:P-loop NTPase [Pirellulales bacterium]